MMCLANKEKCERHFCKYLRLKRSSDKQVVGGANECLCGSVHSIIVNCKVSMGEEQIVFLWVFFFFSLFKFQENLT